MIRKGLSPSYILSTMKQGFAKEGWTYGMLLGTIVSDKIISKSGILPSRFSFAGKKLSYFRHPYNHTWVNERAIEIPLVLYDVLETAPQHMLEIGNVLKYYYPTLTHKVVDKYEKVEGVVNKDVADLKMKQKYELIVSISTMEHVGWDETPRDPQKLLKSLNVLIDHLAPRGKLLITMPMGYNPHVDKLLGSPMKFIKEHNIKYHNYFFRRYWGNRWKQVGYSDVHDIAYRHGISARALVLLEIEKK